MVAGKCLKHCGLSRLIEIPTGHLRKRLPLFLPLLFTSPKTLLAQHLRRQEHRLRLGLRPQITLIKHPRFCQGIFRHILKEQGLIPAQFTTQFPDFRRADLVEKTIHNKHRQVKHNSQHMGIMIQANSIVPRFSNEGGFFKG